MSSNALWEFSENQSQVVIHGGSLVREPITSSDSLWESSERTNHE